MTIHLSPLLRDFGKVANAATRDDCHRAWLFHRHIEVRSPAISIEAEFFSEPATQFDKHPAYTRIIKLACDGRVDRYIFVPGLEREVVALPLLADIAQRIFRTALVILVEHDQVSEIDHVNFLELTGCTVVARHDVHRVVHEIDNFTVTLTDTRCFHDDKVETQ